MTLSELGNALSTISSKCYRYHAPQKAIPPYIVWAEDVRNDLISDNKHNAIGWQGTIDLYSKAENEPLASSIESKLEELNIAWHLNAVIYESETGLIHHEWIFDLI